MTLWADPDTVEKKSAEWTPAQLACRLGKHGWWRKNKTYLSHYTRSGAMVIRQRCNNGCRVERENEMDPDTGHLLRSHWTLDYSRADGYLMRDDNGQSLGRIGHDGKAVLVKQFIVGITVNEIDEDED